jgi:hypothetical protein
MHDAWSVPPPCVTSTPPPPRVRSLSGALSPGTPLFERIGDRIHVVSSRTVEEPPTRPGESSKQVVMYEVHCYPSALPPPTSGDDDGDGGGGDGAPAVGRLAEGESFARVDWVAVPKALRARRVNRDRHGGRRGEPAAARVLEALPRLRGAASTGGLGVL